MALDFPTSPTNGQTYEGYIYDSSTSSWRGGTSIASLGDRVSAIESRVPSGTLHQWAGASAPSGYLLCQGQAISRSQYPTLFTTIGTTYGTGDGSTTFNLPDLQGRVPVGKSASGTFASLNNKNASNTETVQLGLTQLPPHTHVQDSHNHSQNSHNHTLVAWVFNGGGSSAGLRYGFRFEFNSGANNVHGGGELSGNYNVATTATNQATTATNQNTGGNGAHNNLQPYIVLNYIIKT